MDPHVQGNRWRAVRHDGGGTCSGARAAAAALGFWAIAVGITAGSRAEDWRWIAYGCWVFALAAAAWACRTPPLPGRGSPVGSATTDANRRFSWFAFGLVVTAAMAVAFGDLANYPMGIYGDPLRDSGLAAANIASGTVRRLFGWGAYNGQGLTVAVLDSVFVRIFGPDRLAVLVPAALVAVADVALFYVLARRRLGVPAAVAGALLLAAAPLHLYFGRRDPLIIFSSLWATILLLLLARTVEARSVRSSALLALGCGLAMTFHAAAKGMAFVVLVLLVGGLVVDCWRGRLTVRDLAGHLVAVAAAGVIGYGPMILETTPRLLFTAGDRVPLLHPAGVDVGAYLQALGGQLWRSWTVYVYTPSTPIQWQTEAQPLLPGWMGVAFLPGVLVLAARARADRAARLLLALVLLLPLSHSALTDTLNDDHRLVPLLSVACLVSAAAVAALRARSGMVPAWALVGLLAWGSAGYAHRFFAAGLAGNDNGSPSARLTFALDHLREAAGRMSGPAERPVTLWVPDGDIATLELLHMREYLQYYFHGRKVLVRPCPECSAGDYYLVAGEAEAGVDRDAIRWRRTIVCALPDPGRCPRIGGPFAVHVPES